MTSRPYTPVSQKISTNARIGRRYQALVPFYKNKDVPDQSVIAKIITEYKNYQRKNIDLWRMAQRAARDPLNPRRHLLHDLYDDLEDDGHLESQVELRFGATLGYNNEVIDDSTGEKDEETSALFKQSWFYDWCELVLQYRMRGLRVLELVDPKKMLFDLVPERNVIPERKMIVFNVTGDDGVCYTDPEYQNRMMEIGKTRNLGIMNKIAPQLIWKRGSQQSWAEFSEKFGMPLITATTNKSNTKDLDALQSILDALGEAARAVLPAGTTIDVKPFAGKDSYQVYDAQINRCNSEISKPIVGGTMNTDNGSSRSQSEVHERNLDDKIAASDRLVLSFIVNDKLIPLMRTWGWKVPEGRTFRYPKTFDLSLNDHWTIVKDALQYFDIPIEWISKTFNIPIDAIKQKMAAEPPANDPEPDPNDPQENDEQEPGDKPVKQPPVKQKKKAKPAAGFFD